jgi:hypothetical protein
VENICLTSPLQLSMYDRSGCFVLDPDQGDSCWWVANADSLHGAKNIWFYYLCLIQHNEGTNEKSLFRYITLLADHINTQQKQMLIVS